MTGFFAMFFLIVYFFHEASPFKFSKQSRYQITSQASFLCLKCSKLIYAGLTMLHPHTELRFVSPEIGYGIFATAFIPKGTITWVKDELDRIIPKEKINDFMNEYL